MYKCSLSQLLFESDDFQQNLKVLWLPKVITAQAFSRIESEQKLSVSANLPMMEADKIFETSDFHVEFKWLMEV
jgi:hypothetical protein